MIIDYREEYRPKSGFEYPQFMQKYTDFFDSIWRVQEVPMERDVRDWQAASQVERDVISGILNGFTLLESHVQQYWAQEIPRIFPKHEIAAVGMAYGFSEVIHAEAYNHLSATLGITDHANFLADESARAKMDYFTDARSTSSNKVKLAVFSGCGEGVSLFGSFSVLLHFSRSGRFTGLRQILSWSVTDESNHSDTAAELFRILVSQTGISSDELTEIYAAFDQVLKNEDSFLDNVFKDSEEIGSDSITLRKDDVKEFLRYRANDRLRELGLNPCYTYDRQAAERITEFFNPMTKGLTASDAFSQSKNGDAYQAKLNLGDWSDIDLSRVREFTYA